MAIPGIFYRESILFPACDAALKPGLPPVRFSREKEGEGLSLDLETFKRRIRKKINMSF